MNARRRPHPRPHPRGARRTPSRPHHLLRRLKARAQLVRNRRGGAQWQIRALCRIANAVVRKLLLTRLTDMMGNSSLRTGRGVGMRAKIRALAVMTFVRSWIQCGFLVAAPAARTRCWDQRRLPRERTLVGIWWTALSCRGRGGRSFLGGCGTRRRGVELGILPGNCSRVLPECLGGIALGTHCALGCSPAIGRRY